MHEAATDTSGLLGGRYRLECEIGRGGMAVVYRGVDTVLRREVAVKLMRDPADDPTSQERFHAEGELLARLNHPRLVTVYDAGVHEDRPYLVMELVNGETLSERRRRGPMRPAQVVAIGAALADVLGYVHARGIAHRDVKPGNVLLDRQDRVMLADFGIARGLGSPQRTAPGITMGTAAYLAPEQVRGLTTGPAADVYALGLVLIEALSGRTVYTGAPDVAALARLHTPPRVDPGLPRPLRDLLVEMTAEDPGRRPSAETVHRRLRAVDVDALPDRAPSADPGAVVPAESLEGIGTQDTARLPRSLIDTLRRPGAGGRRRWKQGAVAAAVLVPIVALASPLLDPASSGAAGGPGPADQATGVTAAPTNSRGPTAATRRSAGPSTTRTGGSSLVVRTMTAKPAATEHRNSGKTPSKGTSKGKGKAEGKPKKEKAKH